MWGMDITIVYQVVLTKTPLGAFRFFLLGLRLTALQEDSDLVTLSESEDPVESSDDFSVFLSVATCNTYHGIEGCYSHNLEG